MIRPSNGLPECAQQAKCSALYIGERSVVRKQSMFMIIAAGFEKSHNQFHLCSPLAYQQRSDGTLWPQSLICHIICMRSRMFGVECKRAPPPAPPAICGIRRIYSLGRTASRPLCYGSFNELSPIQPADPMCTGRWQLAPKANQ